MNIRIKTTLIVAMLITFMQSAWSNTVFSTNANPINMAVQSMQANYLPGDVNQDGSQSLVDVTAMVEHILGKNPINFNVALADLDGDNDVSVTDVMILVDIILNGGGSLYVIDVDGGDTGIGYGGGGTGPAHTNQNNTFEE